MTMTTQTSPTTRLRGDESVWRDAHTGGYIAEVRGLLRPDGVHDWIRLGVYGSRRAARHAVLAARR